MSRERREDGGAGQSQPTRRAVLAGGAGLAASVAGITGVGATDATGGRGARRAVRQSAEAWPSFKNGPANTGYAAGRSAPVSNVEAAWTFDAGAPVRTAPAVAGGSVYVGADDGRLYAVDAATGEFRWRYGTGSTVRGSPAVADGVVAFGIQDAAYHALSTSDGTRQWITTFGDTTRANRPSAVLDGTVYFGTGAARTEGVGEVYAHDLASGDRLWEQSEVTPGGSPTPVGGSVYVGDIGSRGPSAVELAAGDGAVGRREYTSVGEQRTPAAVGDRTYFPGESGVVVFDPDAEYGPNTIYVEDHTLATSVVVAAETFFAVDTEGVVVAIDSAELADQRVLWRYDAGSPAARSPVVAGSTLFVGCEDGSVHAVDAATGEGRWRFETGGAVRGPPAVADGRVYVGSADGALYALTGETDDTTLTSVEGTPTPTPSPSPEPTESPSPTPTRSPTRDPTPIPERTPTATRGPTRTPTATSSAEPTPTPESGSGGGSDASGEGGRAADDGGAGATTGGTAPAGESGQNDAGVGGSPLPGVEPAELLFGVGGAAALGGGLLGVRRLLGDDGPATEAGAESDAAATGDDPTTGGAESTTGGAESTSEGGPTAGTGDPDDGVTGPETVDLDAVRGAADADPDSVAYEEIERVRELDRGGRAVAHEAVVPAAGGERRVELRQPAFEGTLDATVVERFAEAAETWAALGDHDGVVGVVDWGTEPLPWLALDYHERDLAALAGALSPAAAAALATGLAEGVHHGHSRGVTHRAIRPGAVLVDGGSPPRGAVGDWGLAAAVGRERVVERAPAYAAPEQFDGGEAGRATDVYGLGATFYRLFTGRPPFEGSVATVAEATREGTAPRPTAVDGSLPSALDTVLGRAMAVDPADRYESVLYLRDGLADLA